MICFVNERLRDCLARGENPSLDYICYHVTMPTPPQIIQSIDAQILAIITGGVASYSVPDLAVTNLSLDQLERLRERYESIEAAESGELSVVVDL